MLDDQLLRRRRAKYCFQPTAVEFLFGMMYSPKTSLSLRIVLVANLLFFLKRIGGNLHKYSALYPFILMLNNTHDETILLFAQLAAQSQRPHDPFVELSDFPELLDALRDLPLYSNLQLSPRLLGHKILARGAKDALLKTVIETLCRGCSGWILNPCCVFARHAREIAERLPMADIVATDIDPRWERLFRFFRAARFKRDSANFNFRVENAYEARAPASALAICFFGACGSLTDAALRLAINSQANFVVGRACCHENIGMNTEMSTRSPTIWNLGHRIKNQVYRHYATKRGFYGHHSAAISTYPQSETFRQKIDKSGMLRCARHAVDCRLCQLIIDLDRVVFLVEHGFGVLSYSENMFVAARGTTPSAISGAKVESEPSAAKRIARTGSRLGFTKGNSLRNPTAVKVTS